MQDELLSNTLKLFADKTLGELYHRHGYVLIPGFITNRELEDLRELHRQYAPRLKMEGKSIYSNFEENPKDANIAIENSIHKAFAASLEKHFRSYQIYGGSFLIKGFGAVTNTEVHQDWIAVNEEIYPAFSIWVPLQDVDEKSGCLLVCKGSHRWQTTIRGVNFPSVYIPVNDASSKYITTVTAKAGTGIVFGMNTFHGSVSNLQGSERAAVHLVLTNKEASLIHFIHEPEKKRMAVVDCSRDFMYDYIFEIQKGRYPAAMKILGYIPDTGNWKISKEGWFSLAAAYPQ